MTMHSSFSANTNDVGKADLIGWTVQCTFYTSCINHIIMLAPWQVTSRFYLIAMKIKFGKDLGTRQTTTINLVNLVTTSLLGVTWWNV